MRPAARNNDNHVCNFVKPAGPTPHVGGPVTTGTRKVLVNGQEAAIFGDDSECTGIGSPAPKDAIVGGNLMVFIGGNPAARKDEVTYGGNVVIGSPNVFHNASVSVLSELAASWLHDFLAQQEQIPFGYPWDGCYARAHEMRRLMEQNFGIEVSSIKKIFVEGTLKPDLDPSAIHRNSGLPSSVGWRYHVAPALIGPNGEVWVIDPSLSPDTLLTKDEWVNLTAGKYGSPNAPHIEDADAYYGATSRDPNYTNTNATMEGYSEDMKNGNYVDKKQPPGISAKSAFPPPAIPPPHLP